MTSPPSRMDGLSVSPTPNTMRTQRENNNSNNKDTKNASTLDDLDFEPLNSSSTLSQTKHYLKSLHPFKILLPKQPSYLNSSPARKHQSLESCHSMINEANRTVPPLEGNPLFELWLKEDYSNSIVSSSLRLKQNQTEKNQQLLMEHHQQTHILHSFNELLSQPVVDILQLQTLTLVSKSSIPPQVRCQVWQLLLRYHHPNADIRAAQLSLSRELYKTNLNALLSQAPTREVTSLFNQIKLDIPRSNSFNHFEFFQVPRVHAILLHVLGLWSYEHPAIQYFQGLNDLCVPFLFVLISAEFNGSFSFFPEFYKRFPPSSIDSNPEIAAYYDHLEADLYWCLTLFTQGKYFAHYYREDMTGVSEWIRNFEFMTKIYDRELFEKMKILGIEGGMYAVPWMICGMSRELGGEIEQVIKIWDKYVATDEEERVKENMRCAVAWLKEVKEDVMKGKDMGRVVKMLQMGGVDRDVSKKGTEAERVWKRRGEVKKAEEKWEAAVKTGTMFGLMVVAILMVCILKEMYHRYHMEEKIEEEEGSEEEEEQESEEESEED
eukprot:TRINITY_DN10919_c0_g1_i1.p1 TRINITY_DN10919_c0_g1~~TRINITY_DN10919_c0_g1_i1.p1  ORF type:complete len:549 (+),score=136.21 TRINITY_DN10919_c0_g1_i1:80-1726(+)